MSHVSKAIKLLNLLTLLLFITSGSIINAQVPYNNESGKISVENSYKDIKIGLALSAGGAKGIAHIGVIIALEEEGIPIDLIAGTSIGSIIGGLYAVGYSGEELRKLVQIINWKEMFSENPESNSELISKRFGVMEPLIVFRFKFWDIYLPAGLLNGQKINDELFKYTVRANFAARSNFDSLFVPFRPVAVDISKGEAIAIDKGDLAQAIRGSMAIPLLFYPAKINNSNMVDGGVLNALPTDIVKKMGADIIIGVDLDGQFPTVKEPKNLMEIADHTINIMIHKLKQNNISLADVLIEPNLENHSSTDYSGFDSLIEIGYRAAKNKIDEIKRIIPPQALLNKKNKRQLNTTLLEKSIIGEIKVIGNKNLFEKVILDDFPLEVGDQFNSNRAIQGSKNIYASGLFNNVWLELDTLAHEKVKININVAEKYPRTIGFGVNYVEDEGLSGFIQIIHFNLFGWGERLIPFFRFGKLRTKVGVEMANDRFFGTPLTFHNGLYYESEYPYLYNTDGKRIGQTDFKKIVGLFSVGIQPYRKVLLSGGIRWERVWVKYSKNSVFDYEKKDNLFLFGELITNNLDHRYLPAKGFKIKLEGETSLNYEKNSELISKLSADLNWVIPLSVTQRIIPYCKMGMSNQKLPVYEKFRLGGSISLPGYNRDELWGNHFIVLGILYRIEILKQMNVQFNFTLGSVYEKYQNFRWNNLSSGVSGGILALSPVGPIGLYYGRNENKRDILYLSIGYEF